MNSISSRPQVDVVATTSSRSGATSSSCSLSTSTRSRVIKGRRRTRMMRNFNNTTIPAVVVGDTTARIAALAKSAAVVALLLSAAAVSVSTAFQVSSPPSSPRFYFADYHHVGGGAPHRSAFTVVADKTSATATAATDKKKKKPRMTTLNSAVAADADTMLLEKVDTSTNNNNNAFSGIYVMPDSADDTIEFRQTPFFDETNGQKKRTKTVRVKGISHNPKSRLQQPKNLKTSANTTNKKKSRSSTMPGFSGESDRQRAYKDGIRLVEERTGKRVRETAGAKRKRRKASGEAMYRNSASVPDSMVMFADEIHQVDRITRSEEIELGEKTQEAIRLQDLYDHLEDRLGREPTDEEWCAASGKINMESLNQIVQEGLDAKNKLVTSNLRMVQSVVNTYIRNGLSAQYNAADLLQEGIVALIRAAEKFEPDRGFKFSTYAMYWVRASVKRNQIFQSRIINVPPRVHENYKRLIRVRGELIAVLGRNPTKKELGEAVGMSEFQVKRCFTAMKQQCFSLDQEIMNSRKPMSVDSAGRDTLIEIVESRTDDGEHTLQKRAFLREDLTETLHRHLQPHEVELLLLRFGLHESTIDAGKQIPIIELSKMVGWKPDKVRRTISKSLKKLKSIGIEEWLGFERELQHP